MMHATCCFCRLITNPTSGTYEVWCCCCQKRSHLPVRLLTAKGETTFILGPHGQLLGLSRDPEHNDEEVVSGDMSDFAREQDAQLAELKARVAYLEPLAVDSLADQLARFTDAADITAPHDVATRQCWELIEASVKKGVNPEEVWAMVRAYRQAHIDDALAELTRQRDELLADMREAAYALADTRAAMKIMNNILAPPCGEIGSEQAWRIGCTALTLFNEAIARAGQGCPHCGDVKKHPPEAPDVCPDYERFTSDVTP